MTRVDYNQRLRAAYRELEEKGVWKPQFTSPAFLLLVKLGFRIPHPYYQGIIGNLVCFFWLIYPALGILEWIELKDSRDFTLLSSLWNAIDYGFYFGVCMATYYFLRRKLLRLTDWHSLS